MRQNDDFASLSPFMSMKPNPVRIMVPVDNATLCLHRFKPAHGHGQAVLMLHGMMSNARVFFSQSGKGLAPWLAEHGYDVYVADLRGKGHSQPPIGPQSGHGQTEMIASDLPALHAAVCRHAQTRQVHWVSHSWGGVVMNSCLLRFPELIPEVRSMVHFAAKRRVAVRNLRKRVEIDVMWNQVLKQVTRWAGYLPARALRIGADNETLKTHHQIARWVQNDRWIDSDDGFDYGLAAQTVQLPPTLYLAAARDPCRGHPHDVRRFRDESGSHVSRVHVLSRQGGARHDYDHVSIVTHPGAAQDHYLMVQAWMEGRSDAVPERF